MTVEQLAYLAKVASATVYRAERMERQTTDEKLAAIAGVLGVSVEELRNHAATSTTDGNGRGREVATDLEPTPSTELARTAGMGSK